jgi:TonB family protein
LKNNFTPGTTIDMPGNSSVAYANYASVVKSIYDAAWKSQALTLPGDIADKNETVKVTITIARDGTVVSAHMIAPSGDAALDASVQRALDRVNFIAPFSDGMTEKEWTRTISFNPELENLSE